MLDSSPVPQLVGDFYFPARAVLEEGGIEFGVGVRIGELTGISDAFPLYFDDDTCGGGGGQGWANEQLFHSNLIQDGYVKGTDVYVAVPGSNAAFTPRSILNNDGTCTDLVPDDPATTGLQVNFVKDISGFVPPYVVN